MLTKLFNISYYFKDFSVIRHFGGNSKRLYQTIQSLNQNENLTIEKWENAKDYNSIPGPSAMRLMLDFLPGGELYGMNLVQMNKALRNRYGDIYRLKFVAKPDAVFTYNPNDFELVYRNEGIWPKRGGLESFTYYRKVKRPDIFQGVGGLVSEQGESWAAIRNKVNPILMKIQNVQKNLTQINKIATEFVSRLENFRCSKSHRLNTNFHYELKMWSFESICIIALNTRMGLLSDNPDPNAQKLAENMEQFFQLSYEYDVVPSFWKYVETPGFKRLIKIYDNITEITIDYIEAAQKKFKEENNEHAQCVLEKLCRIDKQVAIVMAMDMLMAGIDTTSSAFITTLYHIARNPEKQELLRQELKNIMPTIDTPLTAENMKNMPYLRACIKEALRITPITPGNYRVAGNDLVLSGYRVPKGVGVLMSVMALSNTNTYFPESAKFIPERWLKSNQAARSTLGAVHPFVYLPFGFGPRTCIGKRIAEMEIETLLSKLVRRYNIKWNGAKDLMYTSNIILVPSGDINFQFEPI